jgi:8-oxo-dGTP pyrophosphatase MutT (NUDIX family)
MPSPCGDVIAVHDGRVLLIERAREPDKGGWAFPGGHLEPGEFPEMGALREFQEETGLDVAEIDILDLDLLWATKDGNNIVICYYLLLGEEPELKPNKEEVNDYQWYYDPPSRMARWRGWPFKAALDRYDQRILLR